jgi:TolA-binding protein
VSAPAQAAPAVAVSAVSNEDDLYRAAHRAQFFERDYARAVTAWDAYLTTAPTGSFALEARFNRAVALARLGRATEAGSALLPFARGDYGPYRQSDAQALLDALGR